MLSDDNLMGIEKSDPRELKPLKVRLPLGQVLQLHRMRILGDRSVSQIVEAAIQDYLSHMGKEPKNR